MARQRKDREANIVHFSFFDLLFGAFGAFVFLMILQVISTINMIDAGAQKLIDQTVAQNQQLKKENNALQSFKTSYESLEKRYQELVKQDRQNRAETEKLQQNIVNLNRLLENKAQQEEKAAVAAREAAAVKKELAELRTRLRQTENQAKAAQEKNAQLAGQIKELEKETGELKSHLAQKGEQVNITASLQEKITELKNANRAASERNQALREQISDLQSQVAQLAEKKKELQRQGDVLTSMSARARDLEKELEEAKRKIAAVSRAPLSIATKSIPSLLAGEEINLALAAQGGSPPYAWSLSGELPSGLSLDKTQGLIVGKASGTGDFHVSLKVSDSLGDEASSQEPIKLSVKEMSDEDETRVHWTYFVIALLLAAYAAKVVHGKYKWKKLQKEMARKGLKPVLAWERK